MITKPLLAATIKPDQLHLIKYPILCSPKLDGIRALMVDGKLVSRNFKPIPNKFIRETLERIALNGFDGELMLQDSSASFQDVTSAVMSHDGEPDFIYKVFDFVEDLKSSFETRATVLQDNIFPATREFALRVKFLTNTWIANENALTEYEGKCLAAGYEGVMIRSPEGVYKCGRSTLREGILIKLKRFSDSEAVIISFIERLKNTNEQERNELGYAKRSSKKDGMVGADTLGAFVVRDTRSGIEFQIGSGLDDSLRDTIWKAGDSYIGKIIKYKSLEIGVKEKPRHPVFLGFRHEDDL